MENVFYYLLALLPGLVYPFLILGYHRILNQKRRQLLNLTEGQGIDIYIEAYDPRYEPGDSSEEQSKKYILNLLFNLNYHWLVYTLPIGIIVVFSYGASVTILARAGIPMNLPSNLESLILKTPVAVLAGIAGAYVWSLFDTLRRYQTLDLTPVSLHFVWLRLFAAPILGGLAGATLKNPVDLLGAFGLGAFPLNQVMNFVKARAKEHFRIGDVTVPSESPTLHKIQGLTEEMIARLEDEGLNSTEHLANTDPIRLLLKTSFEWNTILDIIDQAILFNYVGDKIEKLRPIGIRGAMEVAELDYRIKDFNDPNAQNDAKAMAEVIGGKLEQDPIAIKNLIHTLTTDPRVNFIWTLWGDALKVR